MPTINTKQNKTNKKIQMLLKKLLASVAIFFAYAATPYNRLLLYLKSVWTSFLRINFVAPYRNWYCILILSQKKVLQLQQILL